MACASGVQAARDAMSDVLDGGPRVVTDAVAASATSGGGGSGLPQPRPVVVPSLPPTPGGPPAATPWSAAASSPASTPASAATPSLAAGAASQSKRIGPYDFLYGGLLGEGAYAKVLHVRLKAPLKPGRPPPEYAVKIMDKSFIKKEGKVSGGHHHRSS